MSNDIFDKVGKRLGDLSDLPEELSGAAFVRKPFRPRDIVGFVSTALVSQDDGHLHMPPAGEGEGAGAP